MRYPLYAVVGVSVAAIEAPPAADAALPEPKATTIKPGASIAGIKLGMDPQAALKLWGAGSNCIDVAAGRCTWKGSASQGSAYFEERNGKVIEVGIDAGQKPNGENVYKGPLVKWKDKKRIGLGSTFTA